MDLENLLKSGLNYPSGDNCQPFYFKTINTNEFEIWHNGKLARHRLNLSNIPSYLSLGSLIESISLNALKLGYKLELELTPENKKPNDLLEKWARIRLIDTKTAMNSSDLNLLQCLPLRCVDRRLYNKQRLDTADIEWLQDDAKTNENLSFRFQSHLGDEQKQILLDIEEEAWKDQKLAADILHWIRFSQKSAESTKDGMPWKTLALPLLQKPILKLLSVYPGLYKVVVKLGASKGNRLSLKKQFKHSGGFGWIALKTNNYQHVVLAGRTYFRMWLFLNSRGYGFQPMSMGPLNSFAYHFQSLPDDWQKKLIPLYVAYIKCQQKEVAWAEEWIPLWGFRTGKVDTLTARSLRKPLEAVRLF